MSFLFWMGLCGALLLFMALSSAYLRRLPISTSAIYLIIGLLISPVGFNLISIDLVKSKSFFEHITEIAVITSLFIGGLKLRLPLSDPAWRAAFILAGPVMLVSIIGVAAFSHFVFGLSPGAAILLGAILAPTDPVLAGAVSVNNAADKDRMRYGLSGEAGFNDGMAFPFVAFGLLWIQQGFLGNWIGAWALHRLLWAVPAGLLFGYLMGKGVGRAAIWLRSRHRDNEAPNDFLALALIALSYVGAETIGAWGFLSVFAAGLGLRHAEKKIVSENPISGKTKLEKETVESLQIEIPHLPAEHVVRKEVGEEELKKPAVAAGLVVSEIISFGDTAERLLEVMLVVLVGILLSAYWDWRAIPLAAVFFLLIRPLSTYLLLLKTSTTNSQRWLMGWFGIRGIGSLYYLSYALNKDQTNQAIETAGLTVSVVTLSILIHGVSAQPVLNWYEKTIARQNSAPDEKTAFKST